MNTKLSDTERDRLLAQLVKLGDMMGDGLHHEDPEISKEYSRIVKLLFPKPYIGKKRKPSQKFIRTLKDCNCGHKGWVFVIYANGTVGLKCKNCKKETGESKTNNEARIKWNSLN